MNELNKLQKWYEKQCNGRWEHEFGVEISTLDNPGWRVEINGLERSLPPQNLSELNLDNNWIRCSLTDGVFLGYGSISNLQKIIQVFVLWVEGRVTEEIHNTSDADE